MADADVRTIHVLTHGRYLVQRAISNGPTEHDRMAASPRPLLVGFHGYAENAERHLEQLCRVPGSETWDLVAVQGLHRFYAPKQDEVVASWMTRQDREMAIEDNLAYVDRVVAAVIAEGERPSRLVFAGFSQGVAMAFRAAGFGATAADGVIALAGDLPPDVRDVPSSRLPRVLLGRGTRDSWYTDEKMQDDVAHLTSIGVRVDATVFEGAHEWTDEFRHAAGKFLESLLSPVTEP